MAKQNSSYAVILRDDGLEFPGVVGDAVGNPLVLDERNIVSINTYEDGVTITLVGGVDVDVSHDLIVYDGRRKSPSSRYGAKDDEVFLQCWKL